MQSRDAGCTRQCRNRPGKLLFLLQNSRIHLTAKVDRQIKLYIMVLILYKPESFLRVKGFTKNGFKKNVLYCNRSKLGLFQIV